MLLSMSRHLANLVRRNYFLSRFINWDLSQKFHIVISCLGFVLASLHAIGHLTGTFIFGSRRQTNVESYLGTGPLSYGDFVCVSSASATLSDHKGSRSRPGWTGLSAYSCYLLIVICSTPYFRRMSYEAFQVAHLLMFPMIAFLCAHGTAKLLQAPMLGYWLAFPALWVLVERSLRLWRGVRPLDATLECLDDDTLAVTIEGPKSRQWHYCAGQYVGRLSDALARLTSTPRSSCKSPKFPSSSGIRSRSRPAWATSCKCTSSWKGRGQTSLESFTTTWSPNKASRRMACASRRAATDPSVRRLNASTASSGLSLSVRRKRSRTTAAESDDRERHRDHAVLGHP
jgi:hypothetical protein